jgi:hypothetical protein
MAEITHTPQRFEIKLFLTNHQLLSIYNNRRYYPSDVVKTVFREIKRRERYRDSLRRRNKF